MEIHRTLYIGYIIASFYILHQTCISFYFGALTRTLMVLTCFLWIKRIIAPVGGHVYHIYKYSFWMQSAINLSFKFTCLSCHILNLKGNLCFLAMLIVFAVARRGFFRQLLAYFSWMYIKKMQNQRLQLVLPPNYCRQLFILTEGMLARGNFTK